MKYRNFLLYLLSILVIACENKKDDYYKRPDDLAGPIYKQLESEGHFTMFMEMLASQGYDEVLSRTGYFTLFAPNDEACQNFLTEKGVGSVSQLDSSTIREIVQYALIINGYTPQHLAAYQSSNGWVDGLAFRRLTRSSGNLYRSTAIDESGNEVDAYIKNYGVKHIPYFMDEFFNTTGVSSENYNRFFPGVEYTGFNVVDAKVVGDFIVAENGYIYETDKVILPLPNLEEYLYVHPEKEKFTEFSELLNKIAYYELDTSVHGKDLPVYTKNYSSRTGLHPEPNIEQYDVSSTLYQTFCYTMFVPENEVLQQFYEDRLLKFYGSLDDLVDDRPEVVKEFFRTCLYDEPIWYEEFGSKVSSFGVRLDESNVTSIKITSNGFFYGITDILYTGNYFNSVYGEIIIHPQYSNIYAAINKISSNQSLVNLLTSKEIDFTLFLTRDDTFKLDGVYYSSIIDGFVPLTTGEEDITKILGTLIVPGDITDISGKGFMKTYGNQILRFDNNSVWGGGNIEEDEAATVKSMNTDPINGTVYVMTRNVLPPTKTYKTILQTPPTGASYTLFNQYLTNSGLYLGENIVGLNPGKDITILVPTDDAILAAGLPAYNTTDSVEQNIIKDFLYYHIIQNVKYPDGGTYKTYSVSDTIGKFFIYRNLTTAKITGGFQITDGSGNTAEVINENGSCNFAENGASIFQINQVLTHP